MARRGPARVPSSVVRPALEAVARGMTQADAASMVGVSVSTIERRIRAEGVVVLRTHKQRQGALTLNDREEIRVGLERAESYADIAARIAKHRCTVWREVTANGGRNAYRAYRAQQRADDAARR